MTKIEIKNRWTGAVIYSYDVPDDVPSGMALRHALEKAVQANASLDGASLDGARLDGASLDGASLVGARLVGASLVGARLDGARLDGARLDGASLDGARLDGARLDGARLDGARLVGASLVGASLDGARLVGASLVGASLDGARLENIKNDFWSILLRAPAEIQGLRLALTDGRVDGSTYEGPCACLVGTIANVRHANYQEIGIKPDSSRPAERWFMGIKKGDTPETNQISRITVEWLDKFVFLFDIERVNTYSHDTKTK